MDLDLGGTIRSRTAEQTLAIIQPYIVQAGISRLAELTGLDNIGLPVYTCIRPNSKNLSTAQGKGINNALAMCSAYMEAIEQYHAENVTPERMASINSLHAENALFIHPHTLPSGFFVHPQLNEINLGWRSAINLLDQKKYYIPFEVLCFDLSVENLNMGLFLKSTTGLASGNNYHEALCHALYEIIERNCLSEFSRLRLTAKNNLAINLASVDYACAEEILAKLNASQVEVAVFDISNDFGVPAFHCIIADNNPLRGLGRYSGSGAHWHKGIALCRALTEAIQSRLTYIAGSRDDMFPADYRLRWEKLTVRGQRSYDDIASIEIYSSEQQLNLLTTAFAQQHCEQVLVVRHTQADEDITVLHALVPNLPATIHL